MRRRRRDGENREIRRARALPLLYSSSIHVFLMFCYRQTSANASVARKLFEIGGGLLDDCTKDGADAIAALQATAEADALTLQQDVTGVSTRLNTIVEANCAVALLTTIADQLEDMGRL